MTPDRFQTLKSVLGRRQPDLTILSENVHKSHNLAAMIRSCDAVGVFKAHVVSNSPRLPRHHLTSAGSRKWVPIVMHADIASAIGHLKNEGFQVLAAHLMIPMQGHTESLNVSVAIAVILYEAMKQREAAGMYDNSRLDPKTWQQTLFEWAYPNIARRCREKKLMYPALSADGQLLENLFG